MGEGIDEAFIPDQYSAILWNEDEDFKVNDICIIDHREKIVYRNLADRYENSSGCLIDTWLMDDHPQSQPSGVFGYMAFHQGFSSSAVALEALQEFGRIESASWARLMLAAVLTERGSSST